MSKTIISVERVNEVKHHPDADRLDVVQVLGYQVVTGRDNFKVGDAAVYFPPDILLPEEVAIKLGVEKYLKHATFPGDKGKSQCRVGACRLRGLPSHGFLVPVHEFGEQINGPGEWGRDATDYFGAKKYIPPVRVGAGDAEQESYNFPRYTNIESFQRYPNLIEDGIMVVITEKIHGTNVRLGLILDYTPDGHVWNYAAGSHKIRRKEGPGLYWKYMTHEIEGLLSSLHASEGAVVYGEIFGPGIQDLDYGIETPQMRVFDISIDGKYMDYNDMCLVCSSHGIPMVPELYRGPFSKEKVDEYTYGNTKFEEVRCKFKGREGCVIKPVKETIDYRGNRIILKSVSVDYRSRKGARDDE